MKRPWKAPSARRNDAGGLDRYTVQHATITRNVIADPAIGVAVDISDSDGGRLLEHTTFAFAKSADGTAIRSHIHAVNSRLRRDGGALVTDIQFSNVQLQQGNSQ